MGFGIPLKQQGPTDTIVVRMESGTADEYGAQASIMCRVPTDAPFTIYLAYTRCDNNQLL